MKLDSVLAWHFVCSWELMLEHDGYIVAGIELVGVGVVVLVVMWVGWIDAFVCPVVCCRYHVLKPLSKCALTRSMRGIHQGVHPRGKYRNLVGPWR